MALCCLNDLAFNSYIFVLSQIFVFVYLHMCLSCLFPADHSFHSNPALLHLRGCLILQTTALSLSLIRYNVQVVDLILQRMQSLFCQLCCTFFLPLKLIFRFSVSPLRERAFVCHSQILSPHVRREPSPANGVAHEY